MTSRLKSAESAFSMTASVGLETVRATGFDQQHALEPHARQYRSVGGDGVRAGVGAVRARARRGSVLPGRWVEGFGGVRSFDA